MAELSLDVRDAVAIITLDDGKANALRPSNLLALSAALDEAEGVGAIVLTGRPGFFCGGLDLKFLPGLDAPAKREMFHLFSTLMLRIATLPCPTVAALGGHAFGGGALLALACDLRIGVAGPARFATNEVAIGLAMPTFGVEICRTALAGPTLTEALLHGRTFAFEEAHARGILAELVAPEALAGAALARAAALAKISSVAYHATKRRLHGARFDAARVMMESELEGFVDAFDRIGR